MDYCDRSPCKPLLQSLGRYVFGDPDTGDYKLLVHRSATAPKAVSIKYCPFCGTRLDSLELVQAGKVVWIPEDDQPES